MKIHQNKESLINAIRLLVLTAVALTAFQSLSHGQQFIYVSGNLPFTHSVTLTVDGPIRVVAAFSVNTDDSGPFDGEVDFSIDNVQITTAFNNYGNDGDGDVRNTFPLIASTNTTAGNHSLRYRGINDVDNGSVSALVILDNENQNTVDLQAAIDQITADYTAADDALRTELINMFNTVQTNLQGQINALTTRMTTAETDINELQSDLAALQASNNALTAAIDGLTTTNTAQDAAIAALQARADAMEAQLATLDNISVDGFVDKDDLKKELRKIKDDYEEQIASLRKDLDDNDQNDTYQWAGIGAGLVSTVVGFWMDDDDVKLDLNSITQEDPLQANDIVAGQ